MSLTSTTASTIRRAPRTLASARAAGDGLAPRRWGLGAFLLAVVITLLLPYTFPAMLGGVAGVLPSVVANDAAIVVGFFFLSLLTIYIVSWAACRLRGNGIRIDLGFTFTVRDIGQGVAYGIGALVMAGGLAVLSLLGRGASTATANELAQFISLPYLWVYVLLIVVYAPLAEEILFRGLLFGALAKRGVAVWANVMVTAVAFAVYHLEPGRVLNLLAV